MGKAAWSECLTKKEKDQILRQCSVRVCQDNTAAYEALVLYKAALRSNFFSSRHRFHWILLRWLANKQRSLVIRYVLRSREHRIRVNVMSSLHDKGNETFLTAKGEKWGALFPQETRWHCGMGMDVYSCYQNYQSWRQYTLLLRMGKTQHRIVGIFLAFASSPAHRMSR